MTATAREGGSSKAQDLLRVAKSATVGSAPWRSVMNWVAPIVEEICVGMEVTSYESADAGVEF